MGNYPLRPAVRILRLAHLLGLHSEQIRALLPLGLADAGFCLPGLPAPAAFPPGNPAPGGKTGAGGGIGLLGQYAGQPVPAGAEPIPAGAGLPEKIPPQAQASGLPGEIFCGWLGLAGRPGAVPGAVLCRAAQPAGTGLEPGLGTLAGRESGRGAAAQRRLGSECGLARGAGPAGASLYSRAGGPALSSPAAETGFFPAGNPVSEARDGELGAQNRGHHPPQKRC